MLHYTMAFDATGVTGGMVDLVAAGQASIGKKDLSGPICLTAAETGKDDLIARVSEAIRIGPEWKIDHADVKNGQVDLVATMDDKIAGRGTLKVTGSISPTFTDLLVTTDVWQPKPSQGHIHTVLKQENSRVGKCSN